MNLRILIYCHQYSRQLSLAMIFVYTQKKKQLLNIIMNIDFYKKNKLDKTNL